MLAVVALLDVGALACALLVERYGPARGGHLLGMDGWIHLGDEYC